MNTIMNTNNHDKTGYCGKYPEKGFTHSGLFHADDVFATALLRILNPAFTYTRGTRVPEDFDGIVYDIGCGEFDHHQADSRVRENGVPYAAFGLVWERYGKEILEEKDAEMFDREFVQMIDMTDNTGKQNPVSDIIRHMNPEWNEHRSSDEAFAEAVTFAEHTLRAHFKRIRANRAAYHLVRAKLAGARNNILYLGDFIPWREALADSEINYVIYRSLRGEYNVQVVDRNVADVAAHYFPREWRGRPVEELKRISGIPGLHFCHNGGFLCAVDTLEDAWKVAEKMVG